MQIRYGPVHILVQVISVTNCEVGDGDDDAADVVVCRHGSGDNGRRALNGQAQQGTVAVAIELEGLPCDEEQVVVDVWQQDDFRLPELDFAGRHCGGLMPSGSGVLVLGDKRDFCTRNCRDFRSWAGFDGV